MTPHTANAGQISDSARYSYSNHSYLKKASSQGATSSKEADFLFDLCLISGSKTALISPKIDYLHPAAHYTSHSQTLWIACPTIVDLDCCSSCCSDLYQSVLYLAVISTKFASFDYHLLFLSISYICSYYQDTVYQHWYSWDSFTAFSPDL